MSEQPLARSEVELTLDFDDLDDELQRDLAKRVKRAANTAEKELNRIPRASRKAGQQLATDLGAGAAQAARQVRRAARQVEADLSAAADAGGELGDNVDASAGRATAALGRVQRAARNVQQSLFDIDADGSFAEVRREVEAVQQSLFDLDSVEISTEGIRRSAAETAEALDETAAAARRLGDEGERVGERGGRGFRDLLRRIREVAPEVAKSRRGLTDLRGLLISLGGAAALVGPAILAGGAGVAAFAALAIPTIARVIRAQTEMADLWGSLSRAERVSAAQTRQLVDEYRDLTRSLAPDALRVYNGLLANTASLLPRIQPLARNTAIALQDANQAIGEGLESDRAREFFGFLEAEAGPAVEQVTTVVIELAAAAASLVQALAPVAGAGIELVGVLARLLTVVSDLAPGLLQFLAVMVALRTPIAATTGLIGRTSERIRGFSAASKGATVAQKALNLITAAGPNLYLAAGAAVAFFALKLAAAESAAERLVAAEFAINRATGNNLKGYQQVAKALESQLNPATTRANAAALALGRSQTLANVELAQGALIARNLSDANVAAGNGLLQARTAMDNVKAGAEAMAVAYGGTIDQAVQLADTIGLNLSKGILENGQITAAAADKIARYQEAVRLAADPNAVLAEAIGRANNQLLTMSERVNGLNSAFESAFAPALAYFNAQTRVREAAQQANKVFKDSQATVVQRRNAFAQLAEGIRTMAVAEFRSQGTVTNATAAFNKQLPALQKLVGNSKSGREAIDGLRQVIATMGNTSVDAQGKIKGVGDKAKDLPKTKKIKVEAQTEAADTRLRGIKNRLDEIQSKTITVTINEQRVQSGGSPGTGIPGNARGGLILGPGTGRSDSILARLSNGEFVVNAAATARFLPLLRAINSRRFADGGMVGGLPGYATGGLVRKPRGDVDALIGAALALGLSGDRKLLLRELEKQRRALEKRIVAIGEQVGVGFVKSITGSPSEINRAFLSLEKRIARAFSGIRTRVDDLLIARLERLNTRLATLAAQRDKIVAAIEDANELATATTNEARRFAALTGFTEAERADADSIATTLRDRLAKIRKFQRDVEALAARGLDRSVLRQIVEGGPDEGGALAATLRNASRAELTRINALQRQINDTTRELGRESADLLFDAGVQAGKGFLTGLQAQRKQIVKLMTEIAESVSLTVRRTLKIKSPSRVLDADAQETLLGYIRGLQRLRARVQAELARTVAPGREVERARTLAPPAPRDLARTAAPTGVPERSVTVQQTNHIHNVLDPNAVVDIIEGRLVAALR